ncbi:IclR family transcriptional regulator [Pseudonocardia acidicola]|uniref:Helix-turn-helix domain-containing protein n=1 Tax=Pseudonocardia acidicola TaxID=2724939 RepID=A0ABX1SA04_9PSEU|nr:IclR family transcriptional regulator C-terminal domain-containing protein [Pseudonocardia acidicola]NMH97935.1 helix-turn-helix domain-containing protein [Pseudonocardia acidicola]
MNPAPTAGAPAPSPARSRRRNHRTVDRIAQILELAAREHGGLSLTEIAQRVGAPISSVQGLVNGLAAVGYLTEQGRRFVLGPAPYVLNLLADRPPVSVVRHDDLETLLDMTGCTVLLGVMVGRDVIYIDYATDSPAHAYATETRIHRPLIRTATGRVLLANLDKRELYAYLNGLDPADQQYVDGFLTELNTIRSEDVATTRGHMNPEVWAVATPVREDGRVVAAVGLAGTPGQMEGRQDQLGQILRTQVRSLGHRDGRS